MSAGAYSRAIAPPESRKRWLSSVQACSAFNTRCKPLAVVRWSALKMRAQPPSSRPEPVRPVTMAVRRERLAISVVLRWNGVAAGDHRADLVQRAGEHDFRQVHEDEEDDQRGEGKVQRARRLAAAEKIEEPWSGRVDARRH